jgi:hypothetical protein
MNQATNRPSAGEAHPTSFAVVATVWVILLVVSCSHHDERSWNGNPVVVIGIDGATWDVIDPMLERAELPTFQALVDRGYRAPLVHFPPILSPVVWATIATGDYVLPPEHKGMTGNHRPDGIFLAAGPDFRHAEGGGVAVFDVAPAILALLDLPIAQELPGSVPTQLFRPAFFADHPLEEIRQYSLRRRLVSDHEPVDSRIEQEDLEALDALGYTISTAPKAASNARSPDDFWHIRASTRQQALLGEILFLLSRSRVDQARELCRMLHERDGLSLDVIRSTVQTTMLRLEAEFE